jgi:hypothetical protein
MSCWVSFFLLCIQVILRHYCGDGTSIPTECESGEYQNSIAGPECKKCPPGQYCEVTGLETSSGDCDAGYLCVLGASVATPLDGGLTGQQCSTGSFH